MSLIPPRDNNYNTLLKIFKKRFDRLKFEIFEKQDSTDVIDLCKGITGLLDMIIGYILQIDDKKLYFPKTEHNLNELIKNYPLIIKAKIIRKIELVVWSKWYVDLHILSNKSHHIPEELSKTTEYTRYLDREFVLVTEGLIHSIYGIDIGKIVYESETFIKYILHLLKSDSDPIIDNSLTISITGEQCDDIRRGNKLPLLLTNNNILLYRK